MMVGMNISDEQLGGIADRAISDADIDKDGAISFEELKRVSKCRILFNFTSNRINDDFMDQTVWKSMFQFSMSIDMLTLSSFSLLHPYQPNKCPGCLFNFRVTRRGIYNR